MKLYWVTGITVERGKACANYMEPCISIERAIHATRVWIDGYGCASAIIKEEDTETKEKKLVFAGNFVNFIGTKDTSDLDKFEELLRNGEQI